MLQDLLSQIDPTTMILGLLFVIFFVFIQFVLSKSLRDKKTASIIAFCISLLTIYGLSRTGFNLSEIFYGIGINEAILYSIVPIIILAGLIYVFWKVKLRFIFVVGGIILIIASFFVYEQKTILIAGIVALIIGIILMVMESRREINRRQYIKFSR